MALVLVPTFAAAQDGYVLGRGGVTFGTRTAPVVGSEVGVAIAPMVTVYGSYDWHRDISPKFVGDVADFVSAVAGVDVDYRFPTQTFIGGAKVIAPRGAVRAYGLGGFGFGSAKGAISIEGDDVTDAMDEFGFIDKDDLKFTKPVFEVGGGITVPAGQAFVDVGYRFRKFLNTGEPINMSGVYAGVGIGF
jgi:hypothetical protein